MHLSALDGFQNERWFSILCEGQKAALAVREIAPGSLVGISTAWSSEAAGGPVKYSAEFIGKRVIDIP